MGTFKAPPGVERLREHFQAPFTEHGKRWDQLWEREELLLWDRGTPNPALVDALKDREDLFGDPVKANGERKRALVPGCGRGYDVLLLAAHGYDAIGLDISENALKAYEEHASEKADDYKVYESTLGPGSHKMVIGDFFKDDWMGEIQGFDLIYDYTFFCALPVEMRPKWARRTSGLLSKDRGARLITLEFPNGKAPSTGGPPFGLNPDVYVAHLSNPGEVIPYGADGYPELRDFSEEALASRPKGHALQRIAHWQPKRTHKAGEGSDWVGVWRHYE